MILPTKGISEERALLVVGAEVLRLLHEPQTVSRIWERLSEDRVRAKREPVRYDWFVLALDLLHCLGAITLDRGRLSRVPA